MFCTNCGQSVTPGKYCSACGTLATPLRPASTHSPISPLPSASSTPQSPQYWAAPRPRVSGMAVASFVLALVGLFTVGLSAVVGLVLGIVALHSIRIQRGGVRGKGLAVAGIVISALVILIFIALLSHDYSYCTGAGCGSGSYNVN
jgi:hypothetical protein